MNATQEQIEKLRTLQESYNELANKILPTSALLMEMENGKKEMVEALTTKNVQSSTDKTLSAIATDIRSIAQSSITIDGGEMYEKQLFGALTDKTLDYSQPNSPVWNLYQVMANLLTDGRYVGYNGILLCEYAKDHEYIELQNAGAGGAYFTSDGMLYDYDTTHEWNDRYDNKTNRWVAYLFQNSYSNYTVNNTELVPCSIHVGRKMGAIQILATGRMSNLVVTDGNELLSFNTNATQLWDGDTMVIKNITGSKGVLFYNNNINKVVIENCTIKHQIFYSGNMSFFGAESIYIGKNVEFDNSEMSTYATHCVLSTGTETWAHSGGFRPSYVFIEEGTEWGIKGLIFGNNDQGRTNYNKNITIDGIKTLKSPIFGAAAAGDIGCLSYTGIYMDTIESFECNFMKEISPSLGKCDYIKFISAKKSKRGKFSLPYSNTKTPVLEDVIVGEFEDNLNLIGWTPTTVITTEGGATLLDDNIRNHIAANVKDVSQGEPLTITFSQALRNVLTQETEDLFASKGWNISPAKSV